MMCEKPYAVLVGVLDLASRSLVPLPLHGMARLRLAIVYGTRGLFI